MFNPAKILFKTKDANIDDTQSKTVAGLSLVDVVSPQEIEVDFNHIRVNSVYYSSFFVAGYPRYVGPNWLEPLISFDHTLSISMYIYPSQSKGVLDDVEHFNKVSNHPLPNE